MTEERRYDLKYRLFEFGLPQLLEDIEDVCSTHADSIRNNLPKTAEAWDRCTGSLSFALKTIDFSGSK